MAAAPEVPKYGVPFLVHKARNDKSGKVRAALAKYLAAIDDLTKHALERDDLGMSRATLHDAIEAASTLSRDRL